ncbi:putative intracellular protease/amidase [Sinobacterium caligoides]|uniref:Putative intracellular protease/amidase n=1 Tax=Sinobacterium caligoides TaxID=933926 RepID=A0A3N2DK50_9GAMM|nr:type 1 glutamine amidotransferase domain-containing protein [Sinobacterium caligoides]ROS00184.1 putative intracellular protease/amidase [Sinobacterium caligoides]
MKLLIHLIATLLITLNSSSSFAKNNAKVLIVLTSHSQLGDTGKKTGFWLPELTHPYYELTDAGYSTDIASIQGGMAPIDPGSYDDKDEYNNRFLKDPELLSKVIKSIPIENIDPADYSAVIYSGGSGTMWDFPNNAHVDRLTKAIYESNGIVSAICHGPAALINVKLSDGSYLIAGKKIAAFTNDEEADIGQTEILPFLLQDKLLEIGADHIYAKSWAENVVVDGRLITGQNPASAKKVATKIIKHLKETQKNNEKGLHL